MIPWVLLDKTSVSGGDEELRLMKRGAEFSIMLGPTELMNSRRSGSEEALAEIVCERLKHQSRPSIIIGGLGMGFTLRAALAALGSDARIVVAELVPAIISWARGPMTEIFGDCLTAHRVRILEQDVRLSIDAASQAFDAIILDVDNGPDSLTNNTNSALYDAEGLRRARAALRPGGMLAIWASGPDPRFSRRLRKSGFAVDEITARSSQSRRGARHTIWIASRTDS